MKADIKGIITSLNITENNFLVPVFEAVVNSIQSIHEQCKIDSNHKGKIRIILERDKTQTDVYHGKEDVEVKYPISKIQIIDNGIGFNENNFTSFNTAHSTKKIKIGGKGLGRFTMLSIFSNVFIESTFKENNTFYKRNIPFSIDYKEEDAKIIPLSKGVSTGTSIVLDRLDQKFTKQSTRFSQSVVADEILRHCLLYFINGEEPEILIVEDGHGDVNLSTLFNPKDFLINQYLNEKIKDKEFNFYLVKELHSNFNFYSYSADNRTVETKRTNTILPVFKSKISKEDQEYFVGIYITSDFFDKRVEPNRLEIKFDKADKSNIEKNFDTITEKEIEEKLIEIIGLEYSDILQEREIENKNKVDAYLRDEGIGYRWLDIDRDFLQKIPDDADYKKLDELFHELEYKAKKDFSRRKDKLLARDYSNKKEYKDLLNGVLQSIGKENESRLAQYVSHRKVVIDLLEKYLQWQNEQKTYEEESALHNLFFTMGGTEKDIAHSHHNLWLIDERLAYFSYIRSDIAQNKHDIIETESAKEPDITLYDMNYKYGDVNTEGEVHTVVFVEFKRPHRDNLTFLSYQKQMIEQTNGIEQGMENYQGKYMNISPNKTIHYYFICDVKDFNKIKSDAQNHGQFNFSPYGTLIKFSKNKTEEIMTYQQVKASSIQRNKSFFKNLGIE